jgi:guanidinopropionase
MRGNPRTLDWWKTSSDLGYEVVPIKRYRELGPQKTMQLINDRIGDTPLYITFDLDCMDPTVCPGVANLECGIRGNGVVALRAGQEHYRWRRGLPDADQGFSQQANGAFRRRGDVRNSQPDCRWN